MLFKNIILIPFLILSNKHYPIRKKINVEIPATIKIYNAPINENLDMFIELNIEKIFLNNTFTFKINYNNKTSIIRVLGTKISTYNFVLEPFRKNEKAKNLDLLIELEMTNYYLSTSYNLSINPLDNTTMVTYGGLSITSKAPVLYQYNTKTKQANHIYEKIQFLGNTLMDLKNTRIIDLSSYGFKFTSLENYALPNKLKGAFLLYHQIDTDVAFTNGYHKFDYEIVKKEDGNYYFSDFYKFYINRVSGGVQITNSLQTSNTIYPLFIPFTAGYNKFLTYRVQFDNIGLNNNTYQKLGSIKLDSKENSKLDYFYQESFIVDKNVEYGDYNG